MTFSKIGPSLTYLGAMRVIGAMKLVRKASLSSILARSVGKPSVMFLRLPPKKLTSTRLPLIVPGTSSKTKQAAVSSCRASSETRPMSCCQDRPLTSLTSPSLRASSSHWRRSSYGKRGAALERALLSEVFSGVLTGTLMSNCLASDGVSMTILSGRFPARCVRPVRRLPQKPASPIGRKSLQVERLLVAEAPTIVDEHHTARIESIELPACVSLAQGGCPMGQLLDAWITRLEQSSCIRAMGRTGDSTCIA